MRFMAAVAALVAGLSGEALAQEANDPFEPFNRAMFTFNGVVDTVALEPIAKGYRAITPRPVRRSVNNFLGNLRGPVTFFNDVLQGEPKRAGVTAARFGINSTVGIVGILDVAGSVGLERHSEDFGQTLGTWGVGAGPYLVLPLLGPSTIRDTAGSIVDTGLNPINYVSFRDDEIFRGVRTGLSVVAAREGAIEAIQSVKETSVDPYVTIRSSYTLLREASIRNGVTDLQSLPEFEEVDPMGGVSDPTTNPDIDAAPETPVQEPTVQQPLTDQ